MCIIVFRPEDAATPSKETFQQCWSRNPDGGGVMWRDPSGKLKVRNGLMTFEAMWNVMEQIPEAVDAVYHFRIGTHGSNTAENTHPWPIEGHEAALVHNGVISWLSDDRKTSDSKRFADLISRMDGNLLYNQDLKKVFEDLLQGNKIIIMDANEYLILNEKLGIWKDNCWYSNSSFEILKPMLSNNAPLFDEICDVNMVPGKSDVFIKFKSGNLVHMNIHHFIRNHRFYDYTKSMTKKLDSLIKRFTLHSNSYD